MTVTETTTAARRASGSSFYTAMRIMPRRQRDAMFEIYSFCRAVDDVADDKGPRATRLAELTRWRAHVDAVYAGREPPQLRNLAAAVETFALERADFLAVIDGMEMDVIADIRAPDSDTLDLYCDRVASAVGRLSVNVFGMRRSDGVTLAHHLGRALQLTNILRDLDEDADIGRLYLPREALLGAGITTTEPALAMMNPALGEACAPLVARAWNHFGEADAVMRRWPRRVVRTPRIMSTAYRLKLAHLEQRGWSAPRLPVRVSRPRLIWALLRSAVV
ncbi:MAG: presqualene diphosphate synthase HpnD [Xanthobacteraceae bacterium]|jgi:phytoene synthase